MAFQDRFLDVSECQHRAEMCDLEAAALDRRAADMRAAGAPRWRIEWVTADAADFRRDAEAFRSVARRLGWVPAPAAATEGRAA